MSLNQLIGRIARTVLYEGYPPYHQAGSERRWTFGGVHPEAYGRANEGCPWWTRSQCLIEADQDDTVDVHVRFLHLVSREVAVRRGGEVTPVAELTVDGVRHVAGEEAVEREVAATGLRLGELAGIPEIMEIAVPAGQRAEWLDGDGVLLRGWEALSGRVEVLAEPVRQGVFRLTLSVVNTSPWPGGPRAEAMRHTLVSAHSVLRSDAGRFVSLMDPPAHLRRLAAGCRNIGTWPVLVGAEGERHAMLSSPVILCDYPVELSERLLTS
ncbi:hypothetical protein ITP53_17980 [Nonomuraea sp. K274]|uniref:Uncharacterized protein n=1 Tax=Nonomuraea cypriaca TaxID=1187855 RepID=A0A931ACE9_9ACTN|nr:hypothetical protein [Nonomuraea cypriaca]MBF8187589.1 hypothetical protein [Nonomuraea cypriaca]